MAMMTNRNKRTERRALVARVESLEGRIFLNNFGHTYSPTPPVTTITLIHNTNTPALSFNTRYH
jgi:hypothetical protein